MKIEKFEDIISWQKSPIFLILVLGLFVRLVLFFIHIDTPDFFWDDDSNSYVYTAENIMLGNGFSWETSAPFAPDAFRTPGYPVFLLLVRVAFGSYEAALIVQSLMVVGIALIIFLLVKDLGYEKIGYWAAAIFLAMPFSLQVSLKFLTQPFFTFILMLAVWFWIKFLKDGDSKYLLVTAFLLPLLALIRPIAQFIYLPFIASFIYALWINQRLKVREVVKVGFVLGIIFFVGILPWLYRNYYTFDHFSISSIVPSQMYFYDSPAVYAYNHDMSYAEAAEKISKEAEEYFGLPQEQFSALFSSGNWLKEKALNIMFERPSSILVVRGVQFFKFFVRDGIHYWFDYKPLAPMLLERGFLAVLFLGMIVTTISSFWEKDKYKKIVIGFLILIILYFASLSGIMSSAGLRFPVEALFILTGLIGIGKVKSKIEKWKMLPS